MATSTSADLVARAKKYREVGSLQHENIQNVPELLERISKFLVEHETASLNDCSHQVFDNYPDWWMSSKPNYKLAIAEDNTVDQLHKFVANLYDLGIPLTLTEKRTSVIRFIQDVEIWGTLDHCVSASELLDCKGGFMKLLAKCMGIIYPKEAFLDAAIFDATGMSKTKGIKKTSVRIVWSAIVVDRTRAGKIHDYVVMQFKNSQESDIKALEQRVQEYNSKENQWANIFNDSIYFGRFGIRMPLCDRVSPAPLKKPEQRPFKPMGVLRCKYEDTESGHEFTEIEKICDGKDLSGEEWIKIGSIRKDAGQELTEWQAPPYAPQSKVRPQGNQGAGRGGDHGDRQAPAEPGARSGAPVRIRTVGGSGDRPVRSQPRTAQQTRAEVPQTVQREFPGTLAEFREQLEACMGGNQADNFKENTEDGTLVWQMKDDTGRIEMKASNHRVYITGKSHQVRSLCMTVAPFCRQAGDSGSSVAASARTGGSRHGSRPGSEHGGAPSSIYAPSRDGGYAPSMVYAPSNQARSETSHTSSSRLSVQGEPTRRVTSMDFVPEGQGELELKTGDIVNISHDPERGEANLQRWVHGTNERSQETGWFPFSYTKMIENTP
jgi:hypothetical protein